ncbi:F-box/kelch-repeat protein At3g06240-like [Bidens hawaiensis]|uniref:F-box/kelch-repeat protein At3g06240-like n=1 Tax=Bidens hawaiensis TaxID=980011 RepID=UPI0040492A46
MHKRVMIRSARDILKQKKKQKQYQILINKYRENRDNQEDVIGLEIFVTKEAETESDGFTSERHFPFEVDCPQDVTIITSFNGLVCVGIHDKHSKYELKYSQLILWNPLTGDYKTLSKTNAHEECYKAVSGRVFVLCYVSSEDDYKLLLVTDSFNVYIYSLKSDSWRKIEPTEEFHRLSCSVSDYNASLNHKLYVLKQDKAEKYSVMRLDLKTGKLTEAETPFRKFEACLGFTVLRGCIHAWMRKYSNRNHSIDLWRMDGDGHGNWIKVVTFYETVAFDYRLMQPLHLMADEKPNTLIWSYSSMVYKYRDTLMEIAPRGKYLETLVSPNQYVK